MDLKDGMKTVEKWDIVIRPQNKWYDIDLKGVWHYRDLIGLFVRRDFFTAYKQTIIGPFWMVLQPLAMTLMFSVIFGRVANISTGGAPRLLYYLAAYVPWTYFAECFNKTSTTFSANAGIFGKVYFPRLVSPVSSLISNVFKLVVQLLLFIVTYLIFIYKGAIVSPNYHIVFIPFLLVLLAGFGLAFGLIVSSMTNKYRDLTFLVAVGIQMLMYGSSVIISFSSFGPSLQKYLKWNPILWVMEAFRYATTGVGIWSWHGLAYSAFLMLLFLFLSIVIFNRVEKTFMDTV